MSEENSNFGKILKMALELATMEGASATDIAKSQALGISAVAYKLNEISEKLDAMEPGGCTSKGRKKETAAKAAKKQEDGPEQPASPQAPKGLKKPKSLLERLNACEPEGVNIPQPAKPAEINDPDQDEFFTEENMPRFRKEIDYIQSIPSDELTEYLSLGTSGVITDPADITPRNIHYIADFIMDYRRQNPAA